MSDPNNESSVEPKFYIEPIKRLEILSIIDEEMDNYGKSKLFTYAKQNAAIPIIIRTFIWAIFYAFAIPNMFLFIIHSIFGYPTTDVPSEHNGIIMGIIYRTWPILLGIIFGNISLFWRFYRPNFSISFDGLLGVGKSTLINCLKELYNGLGLLQYLGISPILSIYEEKVPKQWLEAFYHNRKVYGFVFQIERLLQTAYGTKSSEKDIRKGHSDISLVDRSVFGNLTFSAVNYAGGSFDIDQFRLYVHSMVSSAPYCVDIALMLNCPVEKVMERIKLRASIDSERLSERQIEEDYIHELNEMNIILGLYAQRKFQYPLYFVDWSKLPDESQITEFWEGLQLLTMRMMAIRDGIQNPPFDRFNLAFVRFLNFWDRAYHEATGKQMPNAISKTCNLRKIEDDTGKISSYNNYLSELDYEKLIEISEKTQYKPF